MASSMVRMSFSVVRSQAVVISCAIGLSISKAPETWCGVEALAAFVSSCSVGAIAWTGGKPAADALLEGENIISRTVSSTHLDSDAAFDTLW